jgi:hypothetical protein
MAGSSFRSFVILAIVILLGTSVVKGQDWPQWRGANRDGKVAKR